MVKLLAHYGMIAAGGALGAVTRVGLSHILPSTLLGLPVPIIVINILGCFFMGLLTGVFALQLLPYQSFKYFMISGFLGGFTTFSAFAHDFGLLLYKKNIFHSFLYVFVSIVASLGFFILGSKLVKTWS